MWSFLLKTNYIVFIIYLTFLIRMKEFAIAANKLNECSYAYQADAKTLGRWYVEWG